MACRLTRQLVFRLLPHFKASAKVRALLDCGDLVDCDGEQMGLLSFSAKQCAKPFLGLGSRCGGGMSCGTLLIVLSLLVASLSVLNSLLLGTLGSVCTAVWGRG